MLIRGREKYASGTGSFLIAILCLQSNSKLLTEHVCSFLCFVVPTATIIGGPDLHVDKGSTINLTCAVKYSPEPPAYIFWYHHDEVISYDSSRGGVSVITEKGDVTTSHLLIQNADLDDSGKYSCSPSNADVASVRVHVLNGEHPEAMQTGGATAVVS
ncbi:AGAP010541-PA, partial [Anopheles gambiae str. PEST]